MDNTVTFLTACDQRYFPLCIDLIASLKKTHGFMPRMRVLDVGLLAGQAATLAGLVEKVLVPDWDVGGTIKLPGWYRAMTARPFLPKYAGDATVIAWLDADVWLQRHAPLQALVDAARGGQLAIVEERFGKGFSVDVQTVPGTVQTHSFDTQSVKANIRACYEQCFGSQIAAAYGDLPNFNVGVFALRADSPSWKIWQDIYAPALARQAHFMAEQQALNVAIRQGLVPVSRQPLEANYTCHLELPWYSAKSGAFTFPGDESRILGVLHLCDAKHFSLLPVPRFPDGRVTPMPLDYHSARHLVR